MNSIIVLGVLAGVLRQREIACHHIELDALSYEDYSGTGPHRVDQRIRSAEAQDLFSHIA